jgi:uncharacterized cupin superfamily protein
VKATVRQVELEPWPIPGELVLSGSPEAAGRVLWRSPDRRRAVVVYRCTPGRFAWLSEADETVTCLEGRAVVTIRGGETVVLEAGDVCHFEAEIESVWEIEETLLDCAVLYAEGGIDL